MFTYGVRRLTPIVCLLCGVSSAQASPISYAFTGTLSQPFDGSTQFSGSFTYNTNLPAYAGITPATGWSYYSGVSTDPSAPPVSLTFNIGNTASSSFGNIVNDEVIVSHTRTNDGFYIYEQFANTGGQNLSAEIALESNNLLQQPPFTSSSLPSSLNLSEFNQGASLSLWGTTASGEQVDDIGTVTSLVAISSVPEPGTILVFLAMGAGFLRYRRSVARGR